MSIYEYQCVDCSGLDQRVAGLGDHAALCTQCGGLTLRLDGEVSSQAWPEPETKY